MHGRERGASRPARWMRTPEDERSSDPRHAQPASFFRRVPVAAGVMLESTRCNETEAPREGDRWSAGLSGSPRAPADSDAVGAPRVPPPRTRAWRFGGRSARASCGYPVRLRKPRTLPTSSESKRPNAGSAEFVRLAVLPKQLGRVAIAGYSGRRADM